MVIASSKSSTTGTSNATTPIGTGKRKSKVPVSTSFSGLTKPRKPRGPRTPYNFFFADERARMGEAETEQDAAATMAAIKQGAADIPGVTDKPKPTFETTKARNKEIARKWRHFAQMQKIMGDNDLMKSYRAKAADDEVRYKTEMAEYAQNVEDFNDAEAEAEQEFLELQTRVVAEARAKYGVKKEEEESNEHDNDEARVQPSSSGTSSPTSNIDNEAAATMTYLASGAGLGRPAPTIPIPHPPPAPQYMNYPHPRMPYCHPPGAPMYPGMMPPHLAHPPTLNALMAQRAGEAMAANIPLSMPPLAANESVSASMAYLQGYAAACNAMMGGGGGPGPAVAPMQQPPAPTARSSPTRSGLEKAVAAAGRITAAPLLEESQQKQADQDIFVARRRQGQKTTEE